MAKVKKSVLGLPIGKIGNIVYRNMNGKLVVSVRPQNYKASYSDKAVTARNMFKSYSKFSSFVNRIYSLAALWNNPELSGSTTYRKILMANKDRLSNEFLSPNNRIAPLTLINPVKSASLINNTLTLTLSDDAFIPGSTSHQLFIVLAFIKPLNTNTDFLSFAYLQNEVTFGTHEQVFPLGDHITSNFPLYQEVIAYSALLFSKDALQEWFSNKGSSFPLNS